MPLSLSYNGFGLCDSLLDKQACRRRQVRACLWVNAIASRSADAGRAGRALRRRCTRARRDGRTTKGIVSHCGGQPIHTLGGFQRAIPVVHTLRVHPNAAVRVAESV